MLTALTRQEAATEAARSERRGEGKKETISGVQGETVTLRCRSACKADCICASCPAPEKLRIWSNEVWCMHP